YPDEKLERRIRYRSSGDGSSGGTGSRGETAVPDDGPLGTMPDSEWAARIGRMLGVAGGVPRRVRIKDRGRPVERVTPAGTTEGQGTPSPGPGRSPSLESPYVQLNASPSFPMSHPANMASWACRAVARGTGAEVASDRAGGPSGGCGGAGR